MATPRPGGIRLLVIAASTALAASVLATSSSAGAADGSDHATAREASAPSTPSYAGGLIVETADGSVSTQLRARAEELTDGAIVRVRRSLGKTHVLDFDQRVTVAAAQQVADALEKRADVVSAVPNRFVHAAVNEPPVSRNDPYFTQQYGVWDWRTSLSGHSLPAGGYSVRAPYLWRATAGTSSVRVAVIDSGITDHAELATQTVSGYDFFTGTAGDPDRDGVPGRDSDPHDPGNWTTANYCEANTPAYNSSWHGTHVEGIITAKANNDIGISGIASHTRVQPIRVLGPCGGLESDVAEAIVWAARVHVAGVPDNTARAQVINLSLVTDGACGAFQSAITTARAAGTVVIAAAGNGSGDPIGAPASCSGVIAVTASNELGQRASYSNLGTAGRPANIAAPGGSKYKGATGYHGIKSTVNAGTQGPIASTTYKDYDGTSMAAAAVSATAALLSTLTYDGPQVETALKYAVRPFPQYSGSQYNCGTTACGRGILDLYRVPAPYGTTRISGTMVKGNTVTAISPWTGNPTRTYRWFRDGVMISNAYLSTYVIKTIDKGHKITVRVSGTKTGFKTLSMTSAYRVAQ